MSGTPYFDQDERDEIQRAKNSGKYDEVIAGQIGISVEELCRLMGWPQWKTVPVSNDQDGDLWAVDRLDAQL